MNTSSKIFVFLLPAVAALLLPIEALSQLVSDDAYYYLKTAKNIVIGEGPTFDGKNLTNGFHPLWMLASITANLLSIDTETSLRLTLLIQGLLLSATVVLLFNLFTRNLERVAAVTVLLILAAPTLLAMNGLETTLLIFSITLLIAVDKWNQFLDPEQITIRKACLLGSLLALVCLSRLDSVFIVAGITLAILTRQVIFSGLANALGNTLKLITAYWPTVAIFLLLLTPYFVWNYATFEALAPLSGNLKSTFPEPSLRLKFLANFAYMPMAFVVATIWLAIQASRKASPQDENSSPHRLMLFGVTLGCLVHLLWTITFMAWGTFQWHMAGYVPVIAVAAGQICIAIAQRLPQNTHLPAMLVMAIAAVAFNAVILVMKDGHHNYRMEAARWTQENLTADATIGLRDAGVYGHFSERSVVNLDGLINGYEFQEAINNDTLDIYFDDIGMSYVADAYTPCDYESKFVMVARARTVLNDGASAPVRLPRRGIELRRENELYRSARGSTCFVIWPYEGSSSLRRST